MPERIPPGRRKKRRFKVIHKEAKITGDVTWRQGDTFPALTSVGGYLDAQGADAQAFPALTSVGGSPWPAKGK